MSEAAAALGRKDADRWLAKAVIDVAAAETPHRAAAGADAVDGEASQAPGASGAPGAPGPDGLATPGADQRAPAGGQPPPAPGRHRHAR
jgi:hypothetical protein